MDFRKHFINLLRGAFPLIHVNSREYDRVIQDITEAIKVFNQQFDLQYSIQIYDTVQSLTSYGMELEEVLLEFCKLNHQVLVVKNLNFYWEDTFRKIKIVDMLYHLYKTGLSKGLHLVNVSDTTIIPELANYFVVVDYPLPDDETIKTIISSFIQEYKVKVKESDLRVLINLCKGMTKAEVENALVLAFLNGKNDEINIDILKQEKARIVRKTGLLEWIQDVPDIDKVGGLENLKRWLFIVAKVMKDPDKAKQYGLDIPKGCLLCGIPGTGKTLIAKAIASLFEVPLFRLDVGRLYGSLVGETERNVREVLKIIDAMSPCVVLVDEVEKALSGIQSSAHTDSGITARVIGYFLYYLQEKKTYAYFVCTANNIELLPPELLRKGRFDEIWYVGLPTPKERAHIWQIHLSKTGRKLKDYDYKKLIQMTEGFTGAEIQAVIQQTLYKAFAEDKEPTTEDFVKTIKETTPFFVIKRDYVEKLEKWATLNKVKKANAVEDNTETKRILKKGA